MKTKAFIAIFWLATVNLGLYGQKHFVSVDGSDQTGNGTEEYPFRNIQYAIDFAGPGDTIMVLPGNYQEALYINHLKSELALMTTHGPENTSLMNPPGTGDLVTIMGNGITSVMSR